MWYTTLIIIFFHHIVIFFMRLGLLIRFSCMKQVNIVYYKSTLLSSSVKGPTPDLGILKGNNLIFYKFLTYPKRYSMLWFKKQDELLVMRKYYMLGHPRAISPDQKKLPFTYNKTTFHNQISSLNDLNVHIDYRFVFAPMHLGVKLEDSFVGNNDVVFDHKSFINHKSILEELNTLEVTTQVDAKRVKKLLKSTNK